MEKEYTKEEIEAILLANQGYTTHGDLMMEGKEDVTGTVDYMVFGTKLFIYMVRTDSEDGVPVRVTREASEKELQNFLYWHTFEMNLPEGMEEEPLEIDPAREEFLLARIKASIEKDKLRPGQTQEEFIKEMRQKEKERGPADILPFDLHKRPRE